MRQRPGAPAPGAAATPGRAIAAATQAGGGETPVAAGGGASAGAGAAPPGGGGGGGDRATGGGGGGGLLGSIIGTLKQTNESVGPLCPKIPNHKPSTLNPQP